MIEILDVPKEFLIENEIGYPPQNKSKNIEAKFLHYINENNKTSSNLTYIPIQWEKYIIDNREDLSILQQFIDNLDKNKKYFTICRHTGGPLVNIDNCLIFTPSGINNILNNSNSNIQLETPLAKNLSSYFIPLLADNYEETLNKQKKYKAVYLGRNTHPVRVKLEKKFKFKSDYYVKNLKTMDTSSIYENNSKYVDLVSQSYFNLCPRGFGPTSYRLVESFQLDSIPIYVSDYFLKPYSEEINWNDLCLFVDLDKIKTIPKQIEKILQTDRYIFMQEYGQHCLEKYFNDEYTYKKITSIVSLF
tara:strand:- start:20 stop:931 length:912 start_codon:yes stop_codon:yes gene_type:complete